MKTKICGITNYEDAQLAVDLGAWAIGFVFYPKSPRFLSQSQARKIISRLPKSVRTVGVFVNPTVSEVKLTLQETGVQTVQLHGDESPEDCLQIGVPVIKAFRLQKEQDLNQISRYMGVGGFGGVVEAVLIDAAVAGKWGGTGELSNWELACRAKQHSRVILSGGLNSDNVQQAVCAVSPYAVDVSSGVEEQPGKKNRKKLEEFFRVIHAQVPEGNLTKEILK